MRAVYFFIPVTLTSLLCCWQVMVLVDTPWLDAVCNLSLLKHLCVNLRVSSFYSGCCSSCNSPSILFQDVVGAFFVLIFSLFILDFLFNEAVVKQHFIKRCSLDTHREPNFCLFKAKKYYNIYFKY